LDFSVLFSRWRITTTITTNGPQLISAEFVVCLGEKGIKHLRTAQSPPGRRLSVRRGTAPHPTTLSSNPKLHDRQFLTTPHDGARDAAALGSAVSPGRPSTTSTMAGQSRRPPTTGKDTSHHGPGLGQSPPGSQRPQAAVVVVYAYAGYLATGASNSPSV